MCTVIRPLVPESRQRKGGGEGKGDGGKGRGVYQPSVARELLLAEGEVVRANG